MDHIGGGSHFDSDFTSFVDDLFNAINCPPPPPAHLTIAKTANPAGPVAVGSPIGFDITVANTGQGAATQVHVSDVLPAGNALNWSLSPAFPDCSISGAVGSQTLDCAFAALAAGATKGPIHVVSNTAKGECGTIANLARVDATNADPASNGASVVVNCPDISVAKTPDNGSVNAGANAVFTIVASNSGTTAATSVVVTDNLPTGYTWTVGGPDGSACSINTAPDPDVLTCNYASIAAGASKTITLTAPDQRSGLRSHPEHGVGHGVQRGRRQQQHRLRRRSTSCARTSASSRRRTRSDRSAPAPTSASTSPSATRAMERQRPSTSPTPSRPGSPGPPTRRPVARRPPARSLPVP